MPNVSRCRALLDYLRSYGNNGTPQRAAEASLLLKVMQSADAQSHIETEIDGASVHINQHVVSMDSVCRLCVRSTTLEGAERRSPSINRCRPLVIDFTSEQYTRRLLSGGNLPVVSACGRGGSSGNFLLDASGGLARDAFTIAANTPWKVLLCERVPALAAIIADGILRLRELVRQGKPASCPSGRWRGLSNAAANLAFLHMDSTRLLQHMAQPNVGSGPDNSSGDYLFLPWPEQEGSAGRITANVETVLQHIGRRECHTVYFDPMWSSKLPDGSIQYSGNATPKLEVQYLAALAAPGDGDVEIFDEAQQLARGAAQRFVVKQPSIAALRRLEAVLPGWQWVNRGTPTAAAVKFAVFERGKACKGRLENLPAQ